MYNDELTILYLKPIIKDLAYFRNWIFATMKPVEIGSKLVFYGSNMFLGSQRDKSDKKDYKHIINETIWY